jgi:excisionase family DNA binding protein
MEYYTTAQVARIIGITKKTLYTWLKKGKIPEPDRDYRNYRIWTEEDIKNCLKHKNRRIPGGRRVQVAEGESGK